MKYQIWAEIFKKESVPEKSVTDSINDSNKDWIPSFDADKEKPASLKEVLGKLDTTKKLSLTEHIKGHFFRQPAP